MTTSSAQVPTVVDQRTGQAVPVYLGGEAPAEPGTTAAPADRGDSLGTPAAAAAVAESAPPADQGDESQTPANDADPAAADPAATEPSDSVAPEDERPRNEKGQYIPRKRFDEVNQRRKAAEEKLA